MSELRDRIRGAWQGRVSGCQLGKPVEVMSMMQGADALHDYLTRAEALPLRDYVPLLEGTLVAQLGRACCRENLRRSEPDDDINYTVLALVLLEKHERDLATVDVARAWLTYLPAGSVFTAERAAYKTLLDRAHEHFTFGVEPGFDLSECSDNEYNDWIGAQIRADMYGWVCPGNPELAADLARRDAELSHRGEGVYGAAYVAALGAALPVADSVDAALDTALEQIPQDSGASAAVALGRKHAGDRGAAAAIRSHFEGMSPVHTLNNLALVVWALRTHPDDFGAAIGDVVAAGLDTDCNGATVGGLWGLRGKPIPERWTAPWRGRVAVSLAGMSELKLEDLVERTAVVAERVSRAG
ncbi:MAG: ADP-ribosylglycohydrolase family protein [Candidatus Binatia bacterium]|nr:ADP-ribosylglycohydrolase family protein [Candidatus Binatia bacterium]